MIVEVIRNLLLGESAIEAEFDDRVYPVQAPQGAQYPLLVLVKAGAPGEYDMAGDVGLERARLQVDVETTGGAAECIRLKRLVRAKLSGFAGAASSDTPCIIQGVFCINDFDATEPATERAGPRVRRRILEFQIWNREV